MNFLDQCDESTKKLAKEFIYQIKTGKIRKRNYNEGFPKACKKGYLEKSLESFKSLVRSKVMSNIMNDSYK